MENRLIFRTKKNGLDLWLVAITGALVIIGLLAIYDASPVAALRDFGDKLYYFRNQLVWITISTLALAFFSFFDYKKLLKLAPVIMLTTLFLLLAVLVPHIGTQAYGARRWITMANFTFQPSEFAKLAIIFYTTAIMVKLEKYKIRIIDAILVYFIPTFIAIGLVILQPDLGTALIFLAIALTIYYVGGAPIWHFLISLPLLGIAVTAAIITEPYRLTRLKSFLDPSFDPQGASYQINQILTAISSGGLFGTGLGASRSKFAFIPEVHSDAILAIIIEELGFVGALILLGLFLFLLIRALAIAKTAKDSSGRVLALGITALIAIQSLFNFASVVALVPLTGVPLPFISYGGSSLLVTMSSIGVLINIQRNNQ